MIIFELNINSLDEAELHGTRKQLLKNLNVCTNNFYIKEYFRVKENKKL